MNSTHASNLFSAQEKWTKHPKQKKNGYHLPRSSPNGTMNFAIFQPPPPPSQFIHLCHPFFYFFVHFEGWLGKKIYNNQQRPPQRPSRATVVTHLQGFTLQLKGETMPRWHKVGRMAGFFLVFCFFALYNWWILMGGWLWHGLFLAKIPEQVDGANWNSSHWLKRLGLEYG